MKTRINYEIENGKYIIRVQVTGAMGAGCDGLHSLIRCQGEGVSLFGAAKKCRAEFQEMIDDFIEGLEPYMDSVSEFHCSHCNRELEPGIIIKIDGARLCVPCANEWNFEQVNSEKKSSVSVDVKGDDDEAMVVTKENRSYKIHGLEVDPCCNCGSQPEATTPCPGRYMVSCPNCYDGAPDSTTKHMIGHGKTVLEAVEEWNKLEM